MLTLHLSFSFQQTLRMARLAGGKKDARNGSTTQQLLETMPRAPKFRPGGPSG
jgi:hypothetical protein